jgi:hypothetical protein
MTLSLSVLRKLICDFLKKQFANFLRLCLPRCFAGYKETERVDCRAIAAFGIGKVARPAAQLKLRGGNLESKSCELIANVTRRFAHQETVPAYCSEGERLSEL